MNDTAPEPHLAVGWVDPGVGAEFPELRLTHMTLPARPRGRSPREVRQRLADLSNRFGGPQAINVRRQPVPAAYRVFFHHIGLDPDTTRTPVEEAVVERMLHGGFRSRGLPWDGLLIATVETGVPVWVLDGDQVSGDLGIRVAREQEPLGTGPQATTLPAGRLVVADGSRVLAVLFGPVAAGIEPTGATELMTLFAVQVAGVPSIHVEEALWACASVLDTAS